MPTRLLIAMAVGAALASIAPTHYAQAANLNTVGFVPFQNSVAANSVSANGKIVTGYITSGRPDRGL